MRISRLFLSMAMLTGLIVGGAALAQAADQPGGDAMTQVDAHEALVGTSWQLVKIKSMDDKEYVPEQGSAYTLRFLADGTVRVRADCNLGTGSWTASAPSKLEFGQIAATQALCPPGSLHDRYMAQFPWVRSYAMKGGNLFLATTADGSIIEFEPGLLPLAATVLGEEVRTDNAGEMQRIVLSRLFDRYVEQQGIEVTDSEVDAYVESLRRGMRAEGLTAADDLTPEEAAQVEQMRRDMGRSMIRQWKLNRALYRQYGGRIIYQQLGPEPLDAYRQYLEERQAAGDFIIHETALADEFWRYFTDDSLHEFYEAGSTEETEAFQTPFWKGAATGEGAGVQPAPHAVPIDGQRHLRDRTRGFVGLQDHAQRG